MISFKLINKYIHNKHKTQNQKYTTTQKNSVFSSLLCIPNQFVRNKLEEEAILQKDKNKKNLIVFYFVSGTYSKGRTEQSTEGRGPKEEQSETESNQTTHSVLISCQIPKNFLFRHIYRRKKKRRVIKKEQKKQSLVQLTSSRKASCVEDEEKYGQ